MKTRFVIKPNGEVKIETIYQPHDVVKVVLHSEELSKVIDEQSFAPIRECISAVQDQKVFHLRPMKFGDVIFLIDVLEFLGIEDVVCLMD